MKTLFVTIALAIASPPSHGTITQFSEALQSYQLDQQLNNLPQRNLNHATASTVA